MMREFRVLLLEGKLPASISAAALLGIAPPLFTDCQHTSFIDIKARVADNGCVLNLKRAGKTASIMCSRVCATRFALQLPLSRGYCRP